MFECLKIATNNRVKIHSFLTSKKLFLIIKKTRIRISLVRTIKYFYFYVLIIHVKIPEKQVRPKNCRNRNPASQKPRESLFKLQATSYKCPTNY